MCFRDVCSVFAVFEVESSESRENRTESQKETIWIWTRSFLQAFSLLPVQDIDIFWDDFEHQLVGTAAIGVTPLLKLDLVREYITLRDFSGNVSGAVEVS